MNHKFLLFGTGVGGNYGCDAIVLGTPPILQRRFPDSEVWFPHMEWRKPDYGNILGPGKEVTVKGSWRDTRLNSLGRAIGRKSGLLTPSPCAVPNRLVKQADCVLSIGGDLYTFAEKEKNWPFPYSIVEAGNEIMRLGKPYIIWCASLGPLEKAGSRLGEMVDHLKACRAIIVREQTSYSYLRDKLKLKDNVFLAADPAFLMKPVPFECPFLERGSDERRVLAINFSLGPVEHVRGHGSERDLHQELVSYIQRLLREFPIKVMLVPHVGRDHGLLQPIYEEISEQHPTGVWVLPKGIGAQKTKWAVSQSNALLTMRFHCALAGFSTGTPTSLLVSTSKGNKICEEMYGSREHSLHIAGMNADALVAEVRGMLDNEDVIREQIRPVAQQMKSRAFSAGDVLAHVLQ